MTLPIPASVSLAGITPGGTLADARGCIEWVRSLGVRHLQLDATMRGMRPRDLDRSARKDLSSILRRAELRLSGLDLFIPPRHFVEAGGVDRAVTAVVGAIEMVGELRSSSEGSPRLAVELPSDAPADVRAQIDSAASLHGVVVADHSWFAVKRVGDEPAPARAEGPSGTALGMGIDPAVVMTAGDDVFDVITRMREPPVQARLSDIGTGGRVAPGSSSGRLDLVSYRAALGVLHYQGPVVIDLRGLPRPTETASRILVAWERSAGGAGTA